MNYVIITALGSEYGEKGLQQKHEVPEFSSTETAFSVILAA